MIQKPVGGGVKKNNVGNYCVVNFRADLRYYKYTLLSL